MKINEIEEYLNEGFVLRMNNATYIYKKKDKMVVQSPKTHFVLDIDDFYSLYQDASFTLIEKENNDFDFEKDNEYYGTLIKHK